MGLPIPGTGTNTGTQVIDTPPVVPFTSGAGFSAAATAIVAATIAVLQALNVLDISEPIRIALIALVGAGILAWAIAAAGDSLARAYGLAHVTRTDPTKENEPAIKTAAFKLAEVYAAANPAVDAQKAATAAQVRLCAFPVPLQVRAQGSDAQAVALFVSGEVGKEQQRYLVGRHNRKLEWVDGDEIYLP